MFAKAKRRRAGIYLVRTRKHSGRRRENGYVGQSNNVPMRIKQHLGQDARHKPKPWTDLEPKWHVLWLPWWASWKWVQNPLEAIAIRLLLPRYNDKMNHGNPRRVTISDQHRQRAARESVLTPGRALRFLTVSEVRWKAWGALLVLAAVAMPVYAFWIR